MLDANEDPLKVIVVGNGGIGKTSMLKRFARGDFTDEYKKTIGAEFIEKDVFVRSTGTEQRLNLYDTAGQECFQAMVRSFYRGAGACVLAFSSTDLDSFHAVEEWKERVVNENPPNSVQFVLCQTKMDVEGDEVVVDAAEVDALAKQMKLQLFKISSKSGLNVNQMFEAVAERKFGKDAQRSSKAAAVVQMIGDKNKRLEAAGDGSAPKRKTGTMFGDATTTSSSAAAGSTSKNAADDDDDEDGLSNWPKRSDSTDAAREEPITTGTKVNLGAMPPKPKKQKTSCCS